MVANHRWVPVNEDTNRLQCSLGHFSSGAIAGVKGRQQKRFCRQGIARRQRIVGVVSWALDERQRVARGAEEPAIGVGETVQSLNKAVGDLVPLRFSGGGVQGEQSYGHSGGDHRENREPKSDLLARSASVDRQQ